MRVVAGQGVDKRDIWNHDSRKSTNTKKATAGVAFLLVEPTGICANHFGGLLNQRAIIAER